MRTRLWHRTRRNRLAAGRKGFSSIVGAIFMVLIVWILASSYFIYTLSQNTVYNDAIREKNLLESNVLSENVQVANTTYVVNGNDKVNVSTSITNIGSLSVQFTTLWAYASNATYTGYNFTQLSNVNVQGGAIIPLSVNMTIQGLRQGSAYSFASWLITGRGNVVPVEIAPPPEPEPEHLPISTTGFFSLDWFYLKYTARYNPTPSDATVISKSYRYVAFYINVTNNGDEAMMIKSTSLIMLLIEWQEPLFYIVRGLSYSGTPTITAYDDGNPIIIDSHQSYILTFAAKSAAVGTWAWGGSLPVGISSGSTPEGGIVMTALVYTMQSQPTKTYAQSLSFRALVLGP